jgi:hypothetical protein
VVFCNEISNGHRSERKDHEKGGEVIQGTILAEPKQKGKPMKKGDG